MPIVNWTIPDSSPLFNYATPNGAVWGDSDAATEMYTNGTFHFTNLKGATASLDFTGSAIYLYGAFRGNHGPYQVAVDDTQALPLQGHVGDGADAFNQTVFYESGLKQGAHTVVLTNDPTDKKTDLGTAGGFVDIDWAVITTGDGNPNSQSVDTWLDDTASNWSYSPDFGPVDNDFAPQYLNSTLHAGCADKAKATLSFKGNSVALYGAVSDNHGGYTVSLDGAKPSTFNGSSIAFRPKILLYLATNLKSGDHKLEVTNLGTTCTDVDWAIVSDWSASGSAPPPPPTSSGSVAPGGGASGASAPPPAPSSSSAAPSSPPPPPPTGDHGNAPLTTSGGLPAANTGAPPSASQTPLNNNGAPRAGFGALKVVAGLFAGVLAAAVAGGM